MQKIEKEEEAAEAQRLEIGETTDKKKEGINQKTTEAIKLIDEGNPPQALAIINDNESIKEKIVLHYNTIGMQNRETKNFDGAVNNYSKALFVSPQDENLHYNIARAYFEEGKPDRAEELLEKALKLNPEFKEGKLLYEYLLKLKQDKVDDSSESGGKTRRLFHKIFPSKK